MNGGPTIIGMEADENKNLIDRLIRRKMRENSRLNLVPAHKMASMIDKYVSSNDSHALETFFDHEEAGNRSQPLPTIFESGSHRSLEVKKFLPYYNYYDLLSGPYINSSNAGNKIWSTSSIEALVSHSNILSNFFSIGIESSLYTYILLTKAMSVSSSLYLSLILYSRTSSGHMK